MKLSEKIQYCRKKAGLTQEELADRLGVSRQAVSKWEIGETTPELGNFRAMAEIFHVSTDWLLNEEWASEEQSEQNRTPFDQSKGKTSLPDWVDRAPVLLRKLLRRYGWLFGIYLSLAGLVLSVLGLIGKYAFSTISSRNLTILNQYPYEYPKTTMLQLFGFLNALSTVTLIVGLLLLASGIVLAILLRRRDRNK